VRNLVFAADRSSRRMPLLLPGATPAALAGVLFSILQKAHNRKEAVHRDRLLVLTS
jgi:hypothetical protein